MIALSNLLEREFARAVNPVAPTRRCVGIFVVHATGVPNGLDKKMTLNFKEYIIGRGNGTAILAFRDLFRAIPTIRVEEYICGLWVIENGQDFLATKNKRKIDITSPEYELYNQRLEEFEKAFSIWRAL